MRRIRLAFLYAALTAVIFTACHKEKTPWIPDSGEEEEENGTSPGEYLLPLIETTDLHGYIVNGTGAAVHYRMAYIADKVNDIRGRGAEYAKDRLLLLDGGDIYQGASISNLLAGEPVYMAMDRMGYDAVAVGNHEFDWDFETLVDPDATMPDYRWEGQDCVNAVPVLCANLYRDGERESRTRDYVIVEKTAVNSAGESLPVRIGVIGFAIDYASSIMTSKFTGKGYSIREDYSIADELAATLESSGQCDATVLLIHGAADNAAGKLGEDSAIDLVLGGHSHQTMTGTSGTGIAYLQGGRYGEHFASASLKFSTDGTDVAFDGIVRSKISPVDSNRDRHAKAGQNAEDLEEDILAVSDYALEATAEQTREVLGYITVSADTYTIAGSAGRACTMANWMCDIIRRIGDADVAFVNGGGVRTIITLDGQARKDITVANVYEMFPFANTTYVYSITYPELLKVLEYSLTDSGASLFTGMTGINCYFKGYSVTMLSKDGEIIYQNGVWADDWGKRKLKLAVSEYLATNQRVDNYTKLKNPLLEWNETSRLLSNDLIDNENAVRVLREEAAASGGHLFIDTATHFLYVQ